MKDLIILTLKVSAIQAMLVFLAALIVLPILVLIARRKVEQVSLELLKAMYEIERKAKKK